MYLGLDLGSSRIMQSSLPDGAAYLSTPSTFGTTVKRCLTFPSSLHAAQSERRQLFAWTARDVVRRVDARAV